MKWLATILVALTAWAWLACPSVLAKANPDQACLQCHRRGGAGGRRPIDPRTLSASVHGGQVGCLQCHPTAKNKSHQHRKTVAPVDCRQCHQQQNRHGRGAGKPARCWSCHGAHDIFAVQDPRSTLNPAHLVRTCGQCHPREAGRGGLLAAILSFRIRGHGKASLSEVTTERRCLACHQGAAAHGETRPITSAACYKCHGRKVGGAIILGSLHGVPGDGSGRPTPIGGDLIYLTGLLVGLGLFAWGWWRRVSLWRLGKPESRRDRPWRRLKGLGARALGRGWLLLRRRTGVGHVLVFWGVLLPLGVIIVTQVAFTLPRPLAQAVSALLDLAGLGLIVGVGLALAGRAGRADLKSRPDRAGTAVLILLGLIGLSGFIVEGMRLSVLGAGWGWDHPVGGLVGALLPASGLGAKVAWRVHFLLVLALVAMMPFTRLRHLILAPLNVYFRPLGPPLALRTIPVDQPRRFGVSTALDLTWKGLLDAEACVSCARCQEACPAFQTDKPLSPMVVMDKILTDARARRATRPAGEERPILAGRAVTPAEIWACTTCGACQEACPISITPLAKIIGMRRALVLNRGELPDDAVGLMRNLELYGDPSGLGPARRLDWLAGLDGLDLVNPESADCLIWVGCQGAFHPRGRQVTLALLRLAERAGRSVSLLGHEEQCCGDPARRLGEEALFQDLARRNIDRLHDRGVTKIVTACPHCRNVLSHEYPDLGGNFMVQSGLEWSLELVESGLLTINRKLSLRTVFHDPCYLARGAGVIESPRRLLRAVSDAEPLELPQSREQTFCCGAGGGLMWLHESGRRINQHRAEQCLASRPELVATACPYCVAMLEDGLSGPDRQTPSVVDVLELLERATR